jgi:hypothetical protein
MPIVDARVEQADDLGGFGVDTGDVRTFVAVAVKACVREVSLVGLAAMFFSNDVIDLNGVSANRSGKWQYSHTPFARVRTADSKDS